MVLIKIILYPFLGVQSHVRGGKQNDSKAMVDEKKRAKKSKRRIRWSNGAHSVMDECFEKGKERVT